MEYNQTKLNLHHGLSKSDLSSQQVAECKFTLFIPKYNLKMKEPNSCVVFEIIFIFFSAGRAFFCHSRVHVIPQNVLG